MNPIHARLKLLDTSIAESCESIARIERDTVEALARAARYAKEQLDAPGNPHEVRNTVLCARSALKSARAEIEAAIEAADAALRNLSWANELRTIEAELEDTPAGG